MVRKVKKKFSGGKRLSKDIAEISGDILTKADRIKLTAVIWLEK